MLNNKTIQEVTKAKSADVPGSWELSPHRRDTWMSSIKRQVITACGSAVVATGLVVGLLSASTPIFSAHTGSMEDRVAHLENAVRQLTLDTNHHLVVVAHTGQTQQAPQQPNQQPNNNEPNGNQPNSPNTNPPNTNEPNGQPPSNQQPNTQPVSVPAPTPTPTATPTPRPECTEGEQRHGEWQDIGRERRVFENGVRYIIRNQWQQREQCIDGKWKEVSPGQRQQKTRG